MRWLWLAMVLGCASPDPGWTGTSPTHAGAEAAPLPPVARALREDPAPPPEASPDEDAHHHHGHGHGQGDASTEGGGHDHAR
ncbi:MAG: hypothetical protein VYE22_07345 [Myxococcota bacterium]|nr:hypothetical protein [Myxococcota bacterium]